MLPVGTLTFVGTFTLGTLAVGTLTFVGTFTLGTLPVGTLTFGMLVGTLTLGTLTVGTFTPPALAPSAPTTTAQRATKTLTSFVALILSLPGLEVGVLVKCRQCSALLMLLRGEGSSPCQNHYLARMLIRL
jgi:hypothetical protein